MVVCGLLETLVPNEDSRFPADAMGSTHVMQDCTWSNASSVLGWHKKKKCWRIVDNSGRACVVVPHFIVSSVQASSCSGARAGRIRPRPQAGFRV